MKTITFKNGYTLPISDEEYNILSARLSLGIKNDFFTFTNQNGDAIQTLRLSEIVVIS